jgi:hypothetical protein
MVKLDAK